VLPPFAFFTFLMTIRRLAARARSDIHAFIELNDVVNKGTENK